MGKFDRRYSDIGYIDTLAAGSSFLHVLDPRAKLFTTLVFIVAVVSFDKYALSSLVPFFVFPIALASAGGLPVRYLLKQVLWALPFAAVIGIFNPFMDRQVVFHIGSLCVTGGWISFFSILLRAALTVSSVLILISLTGFNAVCFALEKLGAPQAFVIQLLFFYRYLFVLTEESERLMRARSLRAFSSRAMNIGTFVSLSGQLLLRTMDRAQRIYLAMCCRGFDGEVRIIRRMRIRRAEIVFSACWISLFVLFRFYDVSEKLGVWLTGAFR